MAKKIPLRQCIGCRNMAPKNELIRVVKDASAVAETDDKVLLDVSGKINGRGAYICKNKECLNKALKTKALDRTFGVSIPKETLEVLSKEFEKFESK